METKPFDIQAPEQIAKDYGGNKQQIAQAVQNGLLDPTAAVLAGMFIDRMREAQMEEQGAPQTVAQDVFTPPQPMQPQMGMAPPMAAPAPDMGMPAPTQVGLEALPVPDDMFAGPGMASGGLVAFSPGGSATAATPFGRSMQNLRSSAAQQLRRARLVGSEAAERAALRDMLVEQYGPKAGAAGIFMPQTDEERQTTQEFIRNIDSMPTEQLRQIAQEGGIPAMPSPAPTEQPLTPTPIDEPEAPEQRALSGASPDDAVPLGGVEVVAPEPMPRQDAVAGSRQEPSTAATEGTMLDRYTRMLEETMQDVGASREEARNMALLQAGLGIMAGESPYALQNIGRGALPATQAYQQQVRDDRRDQRQTIGELANIEMKARELGLTEQRYKDLMRIAEMQVAATMGRGDATSERALTTARINLTREVMRNDPTIQAEDAWALSGQLIGSAMAGDGASGPRTITLDELQGEQPGFFSRMFSRSGE